MLLLIIYIYIILVYYRQAVENPILKKLQKSKSGLTNLRPSVT
jgi:hypothetical protein